MSITPPTDQPPGLMPCPFCNGKADKAVQETVDGNVVWCPFCFARGPQVSVPNDAIKEWNTRAAPDVRGDDGAWTLEGALESRDYWRNAAQRMQEALGIKINNATQSPPAVGEKILLCGFDYGDGDLSCLTLSEKVDDKIFVRVCLYGDDALYVQRALEQTATQAAVVDVEAMGVALNEILERTGRYLGCQCDKTDCDPGDCWPCRMVSIGNIADEALAKAQRMGGVK